MIWERIYLLDPPSTTNMVITEGGFNFSRPYPRPSKLLWLCRGSRAAAFSILQTVGTSPFYRPSCLLTLNSTSLGSENLAVHGVRISRPNLLGAFPALLQSREPPPNEPAYTRFKRNYTDYLQDLQEQDGPLRSKTYPVLPDALQELSIIKLKRKEWERLTLMFYTDFSRDTFRLTFPNNSNPYPYFRLQMDLIPLDQLPGFGLPITLRPKPCLTAFLWTATNDTVPSFLNRIHHLVLSLDLDRARFDRRQGFENWIDEAIEDFCSTFVASIRSRFPNVNKISFLVAPDPNAIQLLHENDSRLELGSSILPQLCILIGRSGKEDGGW
ncbi:hypothetical protein B0J14DRAFT_365733 [Halenospora varia]|nr:hypothetical protein B0J14DRAFT_365733 [Halenospora varia]